MDANAIYSKLNKLLPGAILEKKRFGRSETLSVWVEARQLVPLMSLIKKEPEIQLNWLEAILTSQLDDAFVLTYVLRSSSSPAQSEPLYLRCSVVPASANDVVEVPSVSELWKTASAIETEISEMFGIRFKGNFRTEPDPAKWKGFPLRKNFVVGKKEAAPS